MTATPQISRRRLLQIAAASAAGPIVLPATMPVPSFADAAPRRPRVAALFTELRYRSHAFNILENFFEPYYFCGQLVDPGCDVVSFYADQFPETDLARQVSAERKVPLYETIDAALCCGGRELAVDAVLLIGEHGRYPFNEIGQHLYPRKEFFDQALAVMKRAGRYVPLFNDKHFSYRFDWAKEMCDTAVAHGMPIMAGSSVPLAQRVPPLDLPVDAEFEAALAVHSGDLESYDFHGLEVLQSFVERRRGGETGVANIEVLIGEAADRAGDEGRWPRELLDAALAVEEQAALRRQTWTSAEGLKIEQRTAPKKMKHVILITYRDGLRATVVAIGGTSNRWDFACKLKGESKPRSTAFYNGSWGNRGLFKALSHAIQRLFIERQEPYPHQRTLLTGGMTEAAVKSHAAGRPLDTPHLDVKYQAVDFARFRENGDTWRKLTVDIPQPSVFAPGDAKLTAGS